MQGSGQRGAFGGLPTSLVVCVCVQQGELSLLLLLTPCGSWVFSVFLYLFVHILPQLFMQAVIFSPLWFLCILLLKETFVQVQALKQRIPGPNQCQKEI